MNCKKAGSPYSASQLSDGEKQILALMADMLLAEQRSFVLVDEPELNLHSLLACRVWATIERALPESVFVYATHNLSFAMRPEVENIVVLGSTKTPSIVINDIASLQRTDLRPFLGAIPAVLSTSRAVVVEGDDVSIDAAFYRWLLGDAGTSVVPLGGCDDVAAAVRGEALWARLSAGVSVAGVVDRDYRPDSPLTRLKPCIVLDLHECESFLCLPEVVHAVASALGISPKVPGVEDVADCLRGLYSSQLLHIAARRAFEKASQRLAVSIPKAELHALTTEQAVRARFREYASGQVTQAAAVSPDAVDGIFTDELRVCRDVHASGDVERMLALMPGKPAFAAVSKLVGLRGPQVVRGQQRST